MKTPVPGLYRGIQVWKTLCSGDMSLDQVAKLTGYPKASVLRMLKTLCDLQMAERCSGGLYRAASRLVYSAGATPDFEKRIQEVLEESSRELQGTAEWFEPGEEGLLLTRRASPPDAEVRVKARAGFMRGWNGEADAVAVLGYAFYVAAPVRCRLSWVYGPQGSPVELSATDVKARIKVAAETGLSADSCFNVNGVKRVAAAVMRNGNLAGVLSLAFIFTPQLDLELEKKTGILRQFADKLQEN